MLNMKCMLVTAKKNDNGKWVLIAKNNKNNEVIEEVECETKAEAMDLAPQIYPPNSTWNGRLFKSDLIDGRLIDID